jgi:hypothetical protein
MSITETFQKAYIANPTTTTLFTATASGVPSNFIIRILATSDDSNNSLAHSAWAVYVINWDGTNIVAINKISSETPPTSFAWAIGSNV